MIRRGEKEVTAVYRGDKPIVAVYRGDKVVWSAKPKAKAIRGVANDAKVEIMINGENVPVTTNALSNGSYSFEAAIPEEVTSLCQAFFCCESITSIDLSELDTSQVTDMEEMFDSCSSITKLNLSNFDTSNVGWVTAMFEGCTSLEYLDVSNFDFPDTWGNRRLYYMFNRCSSLKRIKCKTAFRDWCWSNETAIGLPDAMLSGGSGTWELVD